MTGFKKSHIDYYWPRPAALTEEAGFTRNEMHQRTPDLELFESYARICLHLKKLATNPELKIARRESGLKVHNYGPLSAFRPRFKLWLETAPQEFKEILSFPDWEMMKSRLPSNTRDVSPKPHETFFHPFLPACLQHLDVLARGENPSPGVIENVNLEFERLCGDAFRCIGFEVEQLGQGHGRNADCVAVARQERFAVIVDAKVRANGYVLGTEDRKFLEYALTHTRELNRAGIQKVYLVVVGSEFRESDLAKLTKHLADSPIRSVDLVTAKALMRMTEDSIRQRHQFQLAEVAQTLFGNKIIAD
jgi:hypothetical protein